MTGGGDEVAPPVQATRHAGPQLYVTTYWRTAVASLVGGAWLYLGLLVLAAAERAGAHAAKLLLRVLSWLLLYFVPVSMVGMMNVLAFASYAVQPDPGVAGILWRCAFAPGKMEAYAMEQSVASWRGRWAPVLTHGVLGVLYGALLACYLGAELGHLGLGLLYGVGNVVCMPLANKIAGLVPSLDEEYARQAWLLRTFVDTGFLVLATTYLIASTYAGSWLGFLLPVALSGYEIVGVRLVAHQFTESFMAKGHVREAYSGADQGVHASACIAMIQATAEAARVSLVLAHVIRGAGDWKVWAFAISFGLVWNVLVRTRSLDLFLAKATRGRCRMTSFGSLLQSVKFSMGYPGFLALGSVCLARLSIGNAAAPRDQQAIPIVLGLLLLAKVLEDAACACAPRAKLAAAAPEADFSSVAPAEGCPEAGAEEAVERHQREAKHFLETERRFLALPFWAHFSAVATAQFHLLFVVIAFGSGVDHVLGFCDDHPYRGLGRGKMWWPAVGGHDCSLS